MSFVFVDPDAVQAAARQLTRIGWQLDAAAKVAVAVQQVAPAAADEVSGACAATFSGFAEQYSARLAQAVSLHERFIASLTAGAGSYSVSEAAAVTSWGGWASLSVRHSVLRLPRSIRSRWW